MDSRLTLVFAAAGAIALLQGMGLLLFAGAFVNALVVFFAVYALRAGRFSSYALVASCAALIMRVMPGIDSGSLALFSVFCALYGAKSFLPWRPWLAAAALAAGGTLLFYALHSPAFLLDHAFSVIRETLYAAVLAGFGYIFLYGL
jgi:hypothetical protein